MKVTHICTTFQGGAGLCAARIIEATRALGVDARAIVADGSVGEYVCSVQPQIGWSQNWLIQKFQSLLAHVGLGRKLFRMIWKTERERKKHQGTYCFTAPVTGFTDLANHPWVKEADIIHLHWIGGFVDYESFFPKISKPIVWTIHDQNPSMGGFHHSLWKKEAPLSFQKLDDQLMKLKNTVYSQVHNMTLVAISRQMQRLFEQSELLHRFPTVLIHNGINGQQFVPIPQATAREVLGISPEAVVFLFSAQYIHEEKKGLKELIAALEAIHLPNIILLCLGQSDRDLVASFPIRREGFVPNSRLQSIYYSAADYFIMPSFQEAFAQAPMEAMACGTPVVAFPCSGAKDLIIDVNGIVCDDFTVDSLVKGIRKALEHDYDPHEIREDVLNRFSYEKIAQQYVDLYKNCLANPWRNQQPTTAS